MTAPLTPHESRVAEILDTLRRLQGTVTLGSDAWRESCNAVRLLALLQRDLHVHEHQRRNDALPAAQTITLGAQPEPELTLCAMHGEPRAKAREFLADGALS